MPKTKATPKATPAPTPNPSLPFTPITIDGTEYKMVFQHAALALAEDKLLAKGYDVNLLISYLRRTFSSIRVLFAASLVAYHPDLDFNEAQNMVNHDNILEIIQAVDATWKKSMPDPVAADPTQPDATPVA